MKINVIYETQYPWNKQIPVKVKFVSDKDLTAVEVIARPGTVRGVDVVPSNYRLNNIVGGKEYVVDFKIIPRYSGEYRVTFIVIMNDKGVLSNVSKDTTLVFNENLVVTPTPQEYYKMLYMWYGGIFIMTLSALFLGYWLGKKFVYPRLLKWFKKQMEPTF